MDKAQNEVESTVIRAAGGLIWRDSASGRQLAVIRRTRHGEEWTLPKGKLHPDEPWSSAALREVKEETGCEVTLSTLAGCNAYVTNGKPKLVLFWNMDLVRDGQPQDSGEVKEVRWLTVSEALQHLKHSGEKRVLEGHDWFSIPTWNTRLKSWWKRLRLSASAERLMDSLNCYSIELNHLIHLAEEKPMPDKSWAADALALLGEAREALKEGDENRGWTCFHAAQRMELWGLHAVNPEWLKLRGKTIQHEALNKLKSWRKERVKGILSNVSSTDQRTLSLEAICEVAHILHSHFDNEAVKRRAGMKQMKLLVFLAVAAVLLWLALLPSWDNFQSQLAEEPQVKSAAVLMATVMLFGLMGASLSGILSTFGDPGRVKIPDLLFSFRVTLARLVVGVLSALAASVMLMSGFLKIGVGVGDMKTTGVILFAALAAGFSERLVVRALSKAAGDNLHRQEQVKPETDS